MNTIKLSMSKWHIKTTMPFISLGRAGENNSCQILFDVDKVVESSATSIVAYFLDIYDNDKAVSRRSQLLETDVSNLRLFTMLGRQFLGKQGIKTLQVRCIVTDRRGNELRTYLSNKLNVQVEAGYSSISHFDSSIILAQLSDRIQYLTDDVDDLRTHGIPQDVLKDTILRYFSDNPIDTLTEDEVNEIISIYVTNHKADMPKGDKGEKGDNGQDAYELAVEKGFVGTQEQWLESLHGTNGKDGKNGADGKTPIKGTDYWTKEEVSQVIQDIVNDIKTYILNNKADFKGQDGVIGHDGKSAYDIALENGFSGDKTAWLNSLKGDNGLSSYEIAVKNGFVGTEQEFIKSLEGKQGNVGQQGEKGENGKSAYQVAVDNGFHGTETEWLESLRGKDGKDGQDGIDGKNGVNGKDGSNGKNGVNGLSAYEIAVKNGFTGSESLWLKSLKGEKGDKGDDGTSYDDTEVQQEIADINNSKVDKGKNYSEITGTVVSGKLWNGPNKRGDDNSYYEYRIYETDFSAGDSVLLVGFQVTNIQAYPVAVFYDANMNELAVLTNDEPRHRFEKELAIPDNTKYIYVNGTKTGDSMAKLAKISFIDFNPVGVNYAIQNWMQLRYMDGEYLRFTRKPLDHAIITFSIDDSRSDVSSVSDLFISKGVPLCLATVPTRLPEICDNGDTVLQTCLKTVNNGGEILTHNSFVIDANTTPQEYYEYFVSSKKALENAGLTVRGIIKSGGGADDPNIETTLAYLRSYYDYGTGFQYVTDNRYNIGRLAMYDSLEELKSRISKISGGGILNFYAHGSSDMGNDWLTTISELIDYIQSIPNAEIVTIGSMVLNNYIPSFKGNEGGSSSDGTSYDDTEIRAEIDDIWKAQGELGAKNLLVYPYYRDALTVGDVNFTVNDNGSVTVNGISPTNEVQFSIYDLSGKKMYLKEGQYIWTDGIDKDHDPLIYTTFLIRDTTNNNESVISITRNVPFEITKEMSNKIESSEYRVQIKLCIRKNKAIENGIFYPMLRLASDTDDTWQPYAPTNKELAEQISANKNDLAPIIGEYLPLTSSTTQKKRTVDVGGTSAQFYVGGFVEKYGITSTSELALEPYAETQDGSIVAINRIVPSLNLIQLKFDELTEQTTFICKASKISI